MLPLSLLSTKDFTEATALKTTYEDSLAISKLQKKRN